MVTRIMSCARRPVVILAVALAGGSQLPVSASYAQVPEIGSIVCLNQQGVRVPCADDPVRNRPPEAEPGFPVEVKSGDMTCKATATGRFNCSGQVVLSASRAFPARVAVWLLDASRARGANYTTIAGSRRSAGLRSITVPIRGLHATCPLINPSQIDVLDVTVEPHRRLKRITINWTKPGCS